MKLLAARFNTEKHKIVDNKIFVLMGDGCIMEGVTSEASALAGHLRLDNLITIYDSKHVTLDGPLSESSSEDTKMRYKAYGWEVLEVDGDAHTVKNAGIDVQPFRLHKKPVHRKGKKGEGDDGQHSAFDGIPSCAD